MFEIPCITCLCVLIARCEPKVVVLVQERNLLSNEQMEQMFPVNVELMIATYCNIKNVSPTLVTNEGTDHVLNLQD